MLKMGKFGCRPISVMMFLKLPILAFLGKFYKTIIYAKNAEHSSLDTICLKNWKLPNANSDAKGTFKYLLTQYGVASSLSGTSSVNSNTYNIALSPLFFVRGGRVDPNDSGKFWDAGQAGRYWSSRATSSTSDAYYLIFGNSSVDPSNVSRYYGYSLRCLIPTT